MLVFSNPTIDRQIGI
jgi:hypothetical protein